MLLVSLFNAECSCVEFSVNRCTDGFVFEFSALDKLLIVREEFEVIHARLSVLPYPA